jgi:hypothetical protein
MSAAGRAAGVRLKSDVPGTRRWGLIAEHAVNPYPQLVLRDGYVRSDAVRDRGVDQ